MLSKCRESSEVDHRTELNVPSITYDQPEVTRMDNTVTL